MVHDEHPTEPEGDGQEPDGAESDAGGGDRVAKALARAGVASRRDVERMIAEGRVALNGQVLTTPAVKVTTDDVLTVDGEVVDAAEPTRLFRYHKPAGLITANNDPGGRPEVFENLPAGLPRVISVGRLDINTEGLLLLTNDGELARALELPKNAWIRRYRARAYGAVTQDKLDALKDGVEIDGVRYGAIEARIDKAAETDRGSNVWISVAITEGKNREVRRVLEHLGLQVNRLIRLAYGPFQLGDLAVGGVAEVGPRVIREQLAGFLPEEKLPRGSKALFTFEGEGGGRRPSSERASAPATGRDRPARDRPDRDRPDRDRPARPSRAGDRPADRPAERAPKKPGWAKAKPRVAGERSGAPARTPRPERQEGGGPERRPRRDPPSAPRASGGRPSYGARSAAAAGTRPPRRETATDRPFRDRPSAGPHPRSGSGDRDDRPARSAPRPQGEYGSRPAAATDRPRPDRRRPDTPREDRPRTFRPREDRPRDDRPRDDRPRDDRPRDDRPPRSGAPKRPGGFGAKAPRPSPDGDRPREARAPRPSGPKRAGAYGSTDASTGERPARSGPPRPRSGPPSGKPRSGPSGPPRARPPGKPRTPR